MSNSFAYEGLLQLMQQQQAAWRANSEPYTTGTGQELFVHKKNSSCNESCVIHNPSDHPMKDFPTHWRDDRGIMERICPCGVGHPDPDNLAFIRRTRGEEAARVESIHGCCGHCSGEKYSDRSDEER